MLASCDHANRWKSLKFLLAIEKRRFYIVIIEKRDFFI